jgi:hypothetical protein
MLDSLKLRLGIGLLVLGPPLAHPEPFVESGPADSPLSWNVRESVSRGLAGSSYQRVLGEARDPVSTTPVLFSDLRPYGERPKQTAWLSRYEKVPVPAGDHTISTTLSLVLNANSSHLVCAFTEAAPIWAKTYCGSKEIESRMMKNSEFAPAHYHNLRSNPCEVMGALWKTYHVDPNHAGQIVIRPRFVTDKQLAWNAITKERIIEPPGNFWVVEVLGTAVCDEGNTLVILFRDGDLTMLYGEIIP